MLIEAERRSISFYNISTARMVSAAMGSTGRVLRVSFARARRKPVNTPTDPCMVLVGRSPARRRTWQMKPGCSAAVAAPIAALTFRAG